MAACCGGSSLTSVIALLGLSAMGVGGYSYFGGACGSCSGDATAPVAQDVAGPCCAAHEAITVARELSCCGAEQAAVITAANTAETNAGCCEQEAAARPECADGGSCGGCSEGGKTAQTPEQIAQKPAGR